MESYNYLISRAINKAYTLSLDREGIAGFCNIEGPTGLGKSSALFRSSADGFPAVLEQIKQKGLQAIMVTHRWNILHDVYHNAQKMTDSNQNSFNISVIYSRDEMVVCAVTQRPLPHEYQEERNFPDPFEAINEISLLGEKILPQKKRIKLEKTCAEILKLNKFIEYWQKNPFANISPIKDTEEKILNGLCSDVERILLQCMKNLEKKTTQYQDPQSQHQKLLYLQATKHLKAFRNNQWVRRILPAIAWRDDNHHLLIMTTQKLFSSFYDGKEKVRMSNSQLQGKVIFIDEFDYQADVLQESLAQSQIVQEPPECIGQLLEGGKRLLARIEHVKNPIIPYLHSELMKLLDNLEQELMDKSIDLQYSRAFVVPLEQYELGIPFEEKYLFRSDHLISNERLGLRQTAAGFEVKKSPNIDREDIDVGSFLRLMEKYIRRLGMLLSPLTSDESEAYEYLVKINQLLFDAANDYRPSYYSQVLPGQSFHALPNINLPELKGLIKSNILPNTHANIYGLTSWLLQTDSVDNLDSRRIKIKRALLPTTSEGLLVSLASRNLVFALSATSYIERAIGHFDIRWVKNALTYIGQARDEAKTESFLGDQFVDRPEQWFSKPIPYIPTEEDKKEQLRIITSLVKKKENLRKSEVKILSYDYEDAISISEFNEIKLHLPAVFFNVEPTDFKHDFRRNTLLKVLHTLRIAAASIDHKGHLTFVSSIKYIQKWLLDDIAENSRRSCAWFKKEPDLLNGILSNKDNKFLKVFIPVKIDGQAMVICLLNAEAQKIEGFNTLYQDIFHLEIPVFVLTQVASATNGINLDYSLFNNPQHKMDLTALYLIEAKHFYFSHWNKFDNEEGEMTHIGNQLRDLEKLVKYSEISRKMQRKYILSIMKNSAKDIKTLNILYKNTNDYLKNLAADIQQQVGRIERAWNHVPNIIIYVSQDIASNLKQFANLAISSNNRSLISSLNNRLLDDLIHDQGPSFKNMMKKLSTKIQDGVKAVEIIEQSLVLTIRQARMTSSDHTENTVFKIWNDLGHAVLQHDLQWQPATPQYGISTELQNWACFERPKDFSVTDEIWYDPQTWQFYNRYQKGYQQYNPERLYKVVQNHPDIIDWFNKKGYRTSYLPYLNDTEERYLFHPKVVQRILQGRIGEESIRALLKGANIETTQSHDQSFELYDFEVIGHHAVIDAKYWSHNMLQDADHQFELWAESGEDPEKSPLSLIKRLEKIRSIKGSNTVLIIINLLIDEDCALSLFSDQLEHITDIHQASIITLSGSLKSDTYTDTTGFRNLIQFLSNKDK